MRARGDGRSAPAARCVARRRAGRHRESARRRSSACRQLRHTKSVVRRPGARRADRRAAGRRHGAGSGFGGDAKASHNPGRPPPRLPISRPDRPGRRRYRDDRRRNQRVRGSTTGSGGACCGSIVDVRKLNAAGTSESESEPKLHAETQARRPQLVSAQPKSMHLLGSRPVKPWCSPGPYEMIARKVSGQVHVSVA